ncbi:ATP-dependent helicase [Sabulicella glaciei]|uniref:DNA 3'-5' helicase n=1 Tax=Sabulicella glaciei TaxID=2984948 RepID=A0ABT3NZQ5_9PROT|nr:ATP-dependent DNA helicase [Roseococcus sp. MDT2-1-1]MCW8087652.1 ATP-dependent helicase [Roseococcus sp. MDT2-1-1]
MSLTEAQLQAIEYDDGDLQLIACAGSGKTEVVARHIARLLTPSAAGGAGLLPRNIVAFTFTEKAAAELRQRTLERCAEAMSDLVGAAEMYIGTIHGFCLELLRSEVPQFLKYEVLNEIQQTLFVNRSSARSGLTATSTLQGRQLRRYIDTRVYVDALGLLREAEVDESLLRQASVAEGLDAYCAMLHEKGYLDYSAILQEAARALASDAGLRERLAERLRVVIVDEYQDVNPVQERLIAGLHALGAAVRVVGDDDQTIYQWRGSDARNILTFEERYGASAIRLEDNFRSSPGITDVARLVIEKNPVRLQKTMESAERQTYEPGDIVALQFPSPDEEAEYIARTCRALHGTLVRDGDGFRAISWSDMAVLIRMTSMAGPIRAALEREGIPVVSVGMGSLFDTPEAEAARQLFYLMAGQANAVDVIAAWTTANLGVDPVLIAQAVQEAEVTRTRMEAEDQEVRFSVYNIQRQFIGFLERLRIREEAVPGGRGEVVFYNLAKFSQAISDFEAIYFHSRPVQKYESFAGFLRNQAEAAYDESTGTEERLVSVDTVQILTIHRAKGLQWPVVFVPQLVQNRFPPAGRGGMSVWHLVPAQSVNGHSRYLGSEEDERRLFYVAVTRSQKHLHMTTAPAPGSRRNVRPSVFWYDVLESRHVRRTPQDLRGRERGVPQPRSAIANVRLSFSDIRYFFECPYQFKMRTLYGFNAPLDEALGYGKSLHDALAELHMRAISGETVDMSWVDGLVDRHMRVPYAYPSLRATMHEAARRTVAAYIAARQSEFARLEFSEKAIELNLGNGVSVAGRIDLVRRRDSGDVAIVDLKSNERAQAEALTEAQLHIYALGYRELTGHDADFVETYELDQQRRKARTVDEDLIHDVTGRIHRTAQALRDNDFAPAPEASRCAGCDFGRLCSAADGVRIQQ